jgi:hypothetical protein
MCVTKGATAVSQRHHIVGAAPPLILQFQGSTAASRGPKLGMGTAARDPAPLVWSRPALACTRLRARARDGVRSLRREQP